MEKMTQQIKNLNNKKKYSKRTKGSSGVVR